MTRSVHCPTCGKAVEWSEASEQRPFCSDRCRLIDLGEWASENYRIAGERTGIPDDEPGQGGADDPFSTPHSNKPSR